MKRSLTLAILCATFLLCAFGQIAPVNTVAGMGYLYPPTIVAPGHLITVFLQGNVQGDISATVSSFPAPVLQVRPGSSCPSSALCSFLTAITVQIPYEFEPSCLFTNPMCDVEFLADSIVTLNGVAGAPIHLTPAADRVHILTGCDTAVPGGSGSTLPNGSPCAALVTHPDGSPVTLGSPAHGGEEVVAYAVGLGLTTPAVPTGQAASTATPTYETSPSISTSGRTRWRPNPCNLQRYLSCCLLAPVFRSTLALYPGTSDCTRSTSLCRHCPRTCSPAPVRFNPT